VVSALDGRVAQAGREESESGERCGEPWEGCSPFIGAGGVPGSGGRAINAGVNGFNAIEGVNGR
jgi:hypothetical protein